MGSASHRTAVAVVVVVWTGVMAVEEYFPCCVAATFFVPEHQCLGRDVATSFGPCSLVSEPRPIHRLRIYGRKFSFQIHQWQLIPSDSLQYILIQLQLV